MENWKAIKGFAAYEVSDLGRVRSLPRVLLFHRWGKGTPRVMAGRVLKPHLAGVRKSYLYVNIYKKEKMYQKRLHRLVAEAFIPNPSKLPEVNHLGPKSDCRATMLEWRSKAGHVQDKMVRNQQGDGVSFNQAKQQYTAGYGSKGKWNYLGWFDTYEEALQVRKAAIKKITHIV